jgi:hypothetical protein
MNRKLPIRSALALLILCACGTNPGRNVDDDATSTTDAAGDVVDSDVAPDAGDDTVTNDVPQTDTNDVSEELDASVDVETDVVQPQCIDWESPLNQRVADSAEACSSIEFMCSQSESYFDACGCGCRYEPPVCPDPTAAGVQYVANSPEECALIDYDCGQRTFEGPCGCGCLECRPETTPNLNYVATDAETCQVIDYGCPDGWSGFDDEACGCGCEVSECRADKIFGTSGLAAPFALDAQCEFLIVCSPQTLAENGLREAVGTWFDETRCGDGVAFGCPDGTRSFCEPYIAQVDANDVLAACSISMLGGVSRMLCGGDL